MGIKNSRRRSHDIDAVQPDEPDIWEEGKFTPDPDCDRSPVRYRTVTGPDGLPTNARTIYVDWRKSGHIHRFFQCIQVNFDEETIDDSLEIIEDDDSVPDESKGRADMWQAAEIDCSHKIFATYIPMGIIRQADCRWTSSSSIGWILLRM